MQHRKLKRLRQCSDSKEGDGATVMAQLVERSIPKTMGSNQVIVNRIEKTNKEKGRTILRKTLPVIDDECPTVIE